MCLLDISRTLKQQKEKLLAQFKQLAIPHEASCDPPGRGSWLVTPCLSNTDLKLYRWHWARGNGTQSRLQSLANTIAVIKRFTSYLSFRFRMTSKAFKVTDEEGRRGTVSYQFTGRLGKGSRLGFISSVALHLQTNTGRGQYSISERPCPKPGWEAGWKAIMHNSSCRLENIFAFEKNRKCKPILVSSQACRWLGGRFWKLTPLPFI